MVSTTLTEANWNNSSIIRRNVPGEIAQLKQQDGQDILINGSCQLVNSLINDNRIDEYRLLVYPIVLGKGIKLFKDGVRTNLKLAKSTPYPSGVVGLTYQPG